MDSSVSRKDQVWFLRVCHHVLKRAIPHTALETQVCETVCCLLALFSVLVRFWFRRRVSSVDVVTRQRFRLPGLFSSAGAGIFGYATALAPTLEINFLSSRYLGGGGGGTFTRGKANRVRAMSGTEVKNDWSYLCLSHHHSP